MKARAVQAEWANEGAISLLILCADKSAEHVDLLRLHASGIRVAQSLTELPPKKLLQKKLHQAIQLARERLAQNRSPGSLPPTTEKGRK